MPADETLYEDILDSLSDGVFFVDAERKITFWNAGAERITGYLRDEALGKPCSTEILCHLNENGGALCTADFCPAEASIQSGRTFEMSAFVQHKDGHRMPVAVRTMAVRNDDGEIVGAVEVFHEELRRDELEERLRELESLALLDPLTGVGNRRYGDLQMERSFNELHRYGWRFGVISLDIDHFKRLNDTYGHDVGDVALRTVAQTMVSCVRSFDHVVRMGGEEFLVLVLNIDEAGLTATAEKLRAVIEKARFRAGETLTSVTVSVGATLSQPKDTPDTLLKRADELMYQSKESGRNRLTFG